MNTGMKSQVESYNQGFFDEIAQGSVKSAKQIVPFLIEAVNPKSVLDLGCAEGAWLSIFEELGVTDYLGVDGNYVDQSRLLIEKKKFIAADLQEGFDIGRRFDLAICLEVAEHLPPNCAARTVDSLVKHSSCVLFSASIPFQDGTGHINEQWPGYWAKLFREQGFQPLDVVRKLFWNNRQVSWWFAQNSILYYDPQVHSFNHLVGECDNHHEEVELMPIVHPDLLRHKEYRIAGLREEVVAMRKQQTSPSWLAKQIVKLFLGRL